MSDTIECYYQRMSCHFTLRTSILPNFLPYCLDLEEFESNSVLESSGLVARRARDTKPFVPEYSTICRHITAGSIQHSNNMDVQPLQMVIEMEIPREFWDLTILPGCWLWVPLVLREHHAHLDEGL